MKTLIILLLLASDYADACMQMPEYLTATSTNFTTSKLSIGCGYTSSSFSIEDENGFKRSFEPETENQNQYCMHTSYENPITKKIIDEAAEKADKIETYQFASLSDYNLSLKQVFDNNYRRNSGKQFTDDIEKCLSDYPLPKTFENYDCDKEAFERFYSSVYNLNRMLNSRDYSDMKYQSEKTILDTFCLNIFGKASCEKQYANRRNLTAGINNLINQTSSPNYNVFIDIEMLYKNSEI